MAQLVIAAAGAWAGSSLITGTVLGMTGAQIGWMAGSLLGSALTPKQKSEGPRLNDLRVSGTEYGQPIPWVAGSPRISGQIVWASNRRETAKTEEVGKGGGAEYTTYTYDVDLLILLTENQISGVSRIWLNGELVYGEGTTKENVWADLRVYTGASDQLPDPTYEAAVGAADAPAYRGRGCVFIQGLQLGSSGNIPNLTFEVGTYTAYETQDWIKKGNYSTLTKIDANSYFFDTKFVIDGAFQQASTRNPETWIGKRYVEFELPLTSFPYTRNWFFGCVKKTNWDDTNIASASIVGVSNLSTSTTGTFAPGTYVYGAITNFLDPTDGYNINWVGRAGILIDFDASTMTVFWNNATFSKTFSLTTTAVDPLINYYNENFTGFPGSEAYIYNNPEDWLYAPSGVYPFTTDPGGIGSAVTAPVPVVASQLMERAGYSESDYDISDLLSITKQIRGMTLSQISSTRTPMELVQSAFFFEASKSDKIYMFRRRTTAAASIPYEDLGAASDISAETEPLSLVVGNELEVPAQISLSYNNVTEDYNIGTEHSDRLLTGQTSNSMVQMPLGMTPAEAKGVVDAMLWDSIAGLTKTTLALPLKYAYLEPGDVIDVTNNDARQYRFRILTKRDTLPILTFECTLDDVNALTSAEITDENYISETTPAVIAPTVWESMDIPILRDADNSPGYYVAVAPDRVAAEDEWKGAVIVRSWDDVVYEQLVQTSDQCVLGACVDVLGDWTGGNVFDETNTLTVVMQGQLSSSTRSAMLLDLSVNAMLVGDEIIRFRTATLVSSTSDGEYEYVLSSLVRGQRGTEWAMTGHGSDERCVLLNTKLRRITTQTNQINVERYIKAITFGKLLSSATGEQFTDTGVALKPFSPANARALADGSDLVLTWQRRTRLSYRYGGATPSVPLGEAVESYRIKVYDGSTLVRTENLSSPTWTYAAADIAADGFSSGATVTFEIVQISELVGEGYAATIQGTAP